MKIKKFQMGGAAPEQAAQTPEQGGQGAEEQLAQMAQQIISQLGPEASAMLADMIVQMLQGAAQQEQQVQPRVTRLLPASAGCGRREDHHDHCTARCHPRRRGHRAHGANLRWPSGLGYWRSERCC